MHARVTVSALLGLMVWLACWSTADGQALCDQKCRQRRDFVKLDKNLMIINRMFHDDNTCQWCLKTENKTNYWCFIIQGDENVDGTCEYKLVNELKIKLRVMDEKKNTLEGTAACLKDMAKPTDDSINVSEAKDVKKPKDADAVWVDSGLYVRICVKKGSN